MKTSIGNNEKKTYELVDFAIVPACKRHQRRRSDGIAAAIYISVLFYVHNVSSMSGVSAQQSGPLEFALHNLNTYVLYTKIKEEITDAHLHAPDNFTPFLK